MLRSAPKISRDIRGTCVLRSAFLSNRDVEKLLADPSPAARADTAVKVAQAFAEPVLAEGERALAEAIISALARDADQQVRQALAEHIADNPGLPPEVASRLARDTAAAVAVPVLRRAPVFSDAELIELLAAVSPAHQAAIAGRRRVSSELADALVTHGAEPAVATLMGNTGAAVTPAQMDRALERFPDSRGLGTALARRPGVPPKFAARLIAMVAEELRDELIARHRIPPAMAADTMMQVRERALLGLLGEGAEPVPLTDLLADLRRRGQLDGTLVLRALAGGDLGFFEQALAVLVNIPVRNARLLIYDPGGRGLSALYQRSHLPHEFFAMVEAVTEMARGFRLGVSAADRAFFVEAVTSRMLADFADLWSPMDLRWLQRRRSRAQAAQRIAA